MMTREEFVSSKPEPKWIIAYDHLFNVSNEMMHNGSLGINRYVLDILPLWERFDGGERSDELYNEMLRAR